MSEWVSRPDLEELIGREATEQLCEALGGVPFYVPIKPKPDIELAKIVGFGRACALCEAFGGAYITVPLGNRPEPYKSDHAPDRRRKGPATDSKGARHDRAIRAHNLKPLPAQAPPTHLLLKITLINIGVPGKTSRVNVESSHRRFFMFKKLFSARRWLALCGLVTALILAFLAVVSPQQLPVIAYNPHWCLSPRASACGSTGRSFRTPTRPGI